MVHTTKGQHKAVVLVHGEANTQGLVREQEMGCLVMRVEMAAMEGTIEDAHGGRRRW